MRPLLKDAGDLFVMDYVLSALDGLMADRYVPHTMDCANNTKFFSIDILTFSTTVKTHPR
jgi:hypothetical protein